MFPQPQANSHVHARLKSFTAKKLVRLAKWKNMTVIRARYVPITTPVAKISLSFQLSGLGDGFTLSLEIVIIVPGSHHILVLKLSTAYFYRLPFTLTHQSYRHSE